MLTELQRGSIEPGSGGGWVVSFRLPGEPTQQAVAEFSDRSEAEQAYDLLLLRAVADVTPAAPLQLHQPLEAYSDLLDELQRAPWEQVLEDIRKVASDATAERAAGCGEVPAAAAAPAPEQRPEQRQEQAAAPLPPPQQQRPASAQQKQRPRPAQRQGRPASRPVSPAGTGIKQRTLDSFLRREPRPALPATEPQQHDVPPPLVQQKKQEQEQGQQQEQEQRQQPAVQPVEAQGQQDGQQPEVGEQPAAVGLEQPPAAAGGPEPLQSAPQQQAGDAAHGKKRRRLSEAERLQPFAWDKRREDFPFNDALLKPADARRQPKRNRGLVGESTGASSSGGAAANGEPPGSAAADSLPRPAAAAAAAAAATAGGTADGAAPGSGPEAAVAAGTGTEHEQQAQQAVQQAAEEPQPQELQTQDQVRLPPGPAAAQQLPGPAAAALGFGATWLALRQHVLASAAEQRWEEMRGLLAPLRAAGGQAAEEAGLYETVYCSVLDAAKQAQHLAALRAAAADAAAAGAEGGGVRGWVQRMLRMLQLAP